MSESNNGDAAKTAPEPTVNVNGLTAEQQADYDTFCADIILSTTRSNRFEQQTDTSESLREKNTFLRGFDKEDEGCTNLGDMNLKSDYNDWLPEVCTLDDGQQQKLFLSTASILVKTMHHLNKKNLELLKSETTFLLGCNSTKLMETFLKRMIHDEVRALISGAI